MKLSRGVRKIRRRLKRYHIPNRIVSFGGVGSSSLVIHLERGDRDRIWYHYRDKHCLHPELLPEVRRKGDVRACFLFGDPYAAVISVFRRRLHRRHEKAMSRAMPGYRVALKHHTTVEDYLAGGVDRFFFEEHLDNWLGYRGENIQVIAVKYEALADHIQDVLRFLHCHRPFDVRPRTTSLDDQSRAVRRGLDELYGELRQRIDGLPSFIRVTAGV